MPGSASSSARVESAVDGDGGTHDDISHHFQHQFVNRPDVGPVTSLAARSDYGGGGG